MSRIEELKAHIPHEEYDRCLRAIEIYQKERAIVAGRDRTLEEIQYEMGLAPRRAMVLLEHGQEGLRMGAPGDGDAKLRFDTDFTDPKRSKKFYVESSSMDQAAFSSWNSRIAKRFEEEDLPFFTPDIK